MAEILLYVHKDTFLHRLHPYIKIAFIIVVSVICIIATDMVSLILMVLAMLAVAAYSKLLAELLQQLKMIVIMSVIFILITVITMPNGDILGYLIPQGVPVIGGSIPITTGGLTIGIVLTLRFMVLTFCVPALPDVDAARDLVNAMEKVGLPIGYILMFIIAPRCIPTLQIEGQRIHEAQLARGFNPGTGFIGKIRSLAPIAIPLVSNALRTNVLGLTINMRGYRTGKKTHIRERVLVRRDYAVMGVLAVVACSFIALVAGTAGLKPGINPVYKTGSRKLFFRLEGCSG